MRKLNGAAIGTWNSILQRDALTACTVSIKDFHDLSIFHFSYTDNFPIFFSVCEKIENEHFNRSPRGHF